MDSAAIADDTKIDKFLEHIFAKCGKNAEEESEKQIVHSF